MRWEYQIYHRSSFLLNTTALTSYTITLSFLLINVVKLGFIQIFRNTELFDFKFEFRAFNRALKILLTSLVYSLTLALNYPYCSIYFAFWNKIVYLLGAIAVDSVESRILHRSVSLTVFVHILRLWLKPISINSKSIRTINSNRRVGELVFSLEILDCFFSLYLIN